MFGKFLSEQGDPDKILEKAHEDVTKLADAYSYLTAEEIKTYNQNIMNKVEAENENAL